MAVRVLNPRPADVADGLSAALAAAGFEPVAAPVQRFAEPDDDDRGILQDALLRLSAGEFGLLAVTSARTVRTPHPGPWSSRPTPPTLGELLALAVGDARRHGSDLRVASVGSATTAALEEVGIAVDIAAPAGAQSADGLVAEIADRLDAGLTLAPGAVLFPGSSAASPTLAEGLLDLGLMTEHVIAYVPEQVPLPADVAEQLRSGAIAAAVLTSPLIARSVLTVGPAPTCRLVVIGDPTARAVARTGREVAAVAADPSEAALAAATVRALDGTSPTHPNVGGESTP